MKMTIEERLYYLEIATINVLQVGMTETVKEVENLIAFYKREYFCFSNNDFNYFIKTLFKFWAEKR